LLRRRREIKSEQGKKEQYKSRSLQHKRDLKSYDNRIPVSIQHGKADFCTQSF
jgi:hypothetical protein